MSAGSTAILAPIAHEGPFRDGGGDAMRTEASLLVFVTMLFPGGDASILARASARRRLALFDFCSLLTS